MVETQKMWIPSSFASDSIGNVTETKLKVNPSSDFQARILFIHRGLQTEVPLEVCGDLPRGFKGITFRSSSSM